METETPSWERFKENAAPLERGRNVATLERSCVETEEDRQAKENSIRHYESLVAPSEAMAANEEELGEVDDPLVHWLSYIKFHQDFFPSDKQSQKLLMERCTRTLLSQHKYANDVRFIRLCVLYADQTANPGEIFQYLHSQKVGTLTSLFWVAWAYWAETQGDFPFAEKIYKKAVTKKSHPQKLLEQRHRQFEKRMSRHWMNAAEARADGDGDNESEERGNRGVLGGLSEEAFRRNDRSSARNPHSNIRSNHQQQQQQQSSRGQSFPSSSMSTFIDRSAANASRSRRELPPSNSRNNKNGAHQSSNNAAVSTGFQIFAEDGQENAGYDLDRQLPAVNGKRQLAGEDDRLKENKRAAEPWNQRGGIHATSQFGPTASLRTTVKQPPVPKAQPFAVFVDEECANKHVQEELQQQAEEDQRRRHRDERTFRQLEVGDSVAEKLHQDPLRYMKHPAKVRGDQEKARDDRQDTAKNDKYDVKDKANQRDKSGLANSKRKQRPFTCGYDESLTRKASSGQEQCFEEQRIFRDHFKLVTTAGNFNYLQQSGRDESRGDVNDSGMDIDDNNTTTGDISMEDTTSSRPPAVGSLQKENSRRVLFRNNASFERMRDRSINISQCSSTVNEAHAVGVNDPEEETINTKLAMKEMSMMFYSPAVGLDTATKEMGRAKTEEAGGFMPGYEQHQASFDSLRQEENVTTNEVDDDSAGDTAGFEAMLDLMESLPHQNPNNSVLLARVEMDDNDAENQGPGNPHSRAASQQTHIDKHALQPLQEESSISLSCRSDGHRALGSIAQDDPLSRAPVNDQQNNPGFAIFEDSSNVEDSEKPPGKRSQPAAVTILKDETSQASKPEPSFSFHRDDSTSSAKRPTAGFQIFDDGKQQQSKPQKPTTGFQILDEGVQQSKRSKTTSGFQILDESSMASSKRPPSGASRSAAAPFSVYKDEDATETTTNAASLDGDGGDTASLSIMGDLFAQTSDKDDDSIDSVQSSRGRATDTLNSFSGSIITDPKGFGDISMIHKDPTVPPSRALIASPTMTMNFGLMNAVDYGKTHRNNTKAALSRIIEAASANVEHSRSLTKMMSGKFLVYDFSKYVVPRVFRKKLLDRGSEIRIGSISGAVKQELGRGVYGVVVLLNTDNESNETIAVKAQTTSMETLAWEYEILKKIERRVGPRWGSKQPLDEPFPYPKGLAFATLADGGLMSMTAASESGLNLVDVVNLYKLRLGGNVPEAIAIHYTSRMLNHLEMLHWHGKILHCDVKPDNWVLAGVAELTLVDFGRAIDLSELASTGVDAMDVKLTGEAAERDMMCVAMRKDRPWSFDADSFGLCASLHVLLFGTHLEIEQKGKRWMPKQRFRRYWQTSLLEEVFDTLLNSDEGTLIGSRPRSLRSLRKKLEAFSESHSRQLDDELKRLDRLLPSSRKLI